jgi:hypothetical protein
MAGTRVDYSAWSYHNFAARSRRPRVCIGASLVTLIMAGGWIGPGSSVPANPSADSFWEVGKPAAIAVRDGRSVVRVPTPVPGSEVLVVVSSLARVRGPFPIELRARPARTGERPDLADDGGQGTPPQTLLAKTPAESDDPPASGIPPLERIFQMMTRDGDPGVSSNYSPIRGVLKGVGQRVQVYVAAEDRERVPACTVQDLVLTFDDRIFPLTSERVGKADDVDGDGRFTILLSSWLDHLGGGKYPVDGFVRVADLDPAFGVPFGNHCDMMYLNPSLSAGPHLRTVVAHEYMHAALFSQKTLAARANGRHGLEEEGWLDEAIAHLAEDFNGFSTSNIDYRISAFLTRPEGYQLVVTDYYAADLFRSHGSRGSTYLFLRWCADQYGPDLVARLVHSQRRGTANLEAATGSTFASLYRRWSLALFLSGLQKDGSAREPQADTFRSINMRAPCQDWELAGPRFTRVLPEDSIDRWSALGTTSHFAVVESSPSGAVDIEVAGPPGAELQVTVMPLGGDLPRVDLAVTKVHGRRGELHLRARVNERNGKPVRLSALSWEPLAPLPNPHTAGFRCGRLDMLGIAANFGTSALPAAGELRSQEFPLPGVLPETGPLAIKVIGTDEKGRRIAAWAEIDTADRSPGAMRDE